jgi:hypothetical protein
LTYPTKANRLFAIPNGGHRNKIVAKKLKAEGVLAGVPDLCLLTFNEPIFFEVKTPTGTVSPEQRAIHKEWRESSLCQIYLVRSLDDFITVLTEIGYPV